MAVFSKPLLCTIGLHSDVDVRLNSEDPSIVTQQCVRCLRVDEGFKGFPHDHTKGDTGWIINGQNGGGGLM